MTRWTAANVVQISVPQQVRRGLAGALRILKSNFIFASYSYKKAIGYIKLLKIGSLLFVPLCIFYIFMATVYIHASNFSLHIRRTIPVIIQGKDLYEDTYLGSCIISYPLSLKKSSAVCCHVVLTNLNVSWVKKRRAKAHCSKGKNRLNVADKTAVSSILRLYFLCQQTQIPSTLFISKPVTGHDPDLVLSTAHPNPSEKPLNSLLQTPSWFSEWSSS
jgi:hypothetical protein